jgi:hypothetical protein
MRTIVGLAAACVGGLLALGVAAALQPPVVIGKGPTYPAEPTWTEIKWPFPADPWGAGKAYVCTAGDCGADVHLYLRAKIGFCDCSRGVEDDEELERVSDIALVASRYQASRAGRPIAIASMNGRSRPYVIAASRNSPVAVLVLAFHDRCDLIVATAVVADGRASELESAIMRFLNGDRILRWFEKTVGL